MSSTLTPASFQPPPGYRPAASAVEGITVWEPVPAQEEAPEPKTYNCPNCGAVTRYNVAAGGIACEHCGYTAPVQTEQVGTRAEAYEFTLETLKVSEAGWGIDRVEISCDNCGAHLTLPAGELSVTCPFCASNKVNAHPARLDQLRPGNVIPFKVPAKQAAALVTEWLGRGWYHPADLAKSASFDRFTGVYLPFWCFSARLPSQWKAEVGYEHTERYYDAGSKSWKTRTVIRWRWETGQVELPVTDLLVSGAAHINQRILGKIQPFHLQDLFDYSPDYLAGWQAQAYEIPLQDAWETGRAAMREQARQACLDDIPTHHVRNFSMSAEFDDESWRYILLPVFLHTYRFEDNAFQVMINGQTGAIAGQKPVDWKKVWLAILAMFAPGVILALIGLPLLAAGGIGTLFLIGGFVLGVIAFILSIVLYTQARNSEAAA